MNSSSLSSLAEVLVGWAIPYSFAITRREVVIWSSSDPEGFTREGVLEVVLVMLQFVIVATHRCKSIILESAGWGVGGRSGHMSCVFSAGMWAA